MEKANVPVSTVRAGGADEYYAQNLGQVWTFPAYQRYETANWSWSDLPFSDDLSSRQFLQPRVTRRIEPRNGVLEVGSAMGSAYNFLRGSGLVDLSDYVGVEISDMGIRASRERFPETKWVHADFTKYDIGRKFDYVFERIAVHHMPDPLSQYRKMLQATNIAMMTSFRGCVRGATLSDLSRAYFRTRDEKYFCNIINVFELVSIGLELGFWHVRVVFSGLHEPISSDPAAHQYLDPEIAREGRYISRFRVRFSRVAPGSAPKIYLTGSPRVLLTQLPVALRIRSGLAELASRCRAGGFKGAA